MDVAFGMKAGYNLPGPAFFVVWGDNNNTWDGQEWSGIYGSFVDPYKLDYLQPIQFKIIHFLFQLFMIITHLALMNMQNHGNRKLLTTLLVKNS